MELRIGKKGIMFFKQKYREKIRILMIKLNLHKSRLTNKFPQ